jgi:DNA-binding SARP family transcriptional activator
MDVEVLGPIEVSESGRAIHLAGQRQRALLAALALDHGRVVPVARLVDVLWDCHPPVTARAKVQAHVSSLRQALGQGGRGPGGAIVTRPPGYTLSGAGIHVDLAEFEALRALASAARESGQWALASEQYAAALALWRGPACADVTSSLIRAAAVALEERRIFAVEAKAEADLNLGRNETVAAELATPLAMDPLRERLRALAMQALYRLGCRADALGLYREGRRIMISELGLEPGPQLRSLHQRILADDPALLAAHSGQPASPGNDT